MTLDRREGELLEGRRIRCAVIHTDHRLCSTLSTYMEETGVSPLHGQKHDGHADSLAASRPDFGFAPSAHGPAGYWENNNHECRRRSGHIMTHLNPNTNRRRMQQRPTSQAASGKTSRGPEQAMILLPIHRPERADTYRRQFSTLYAEPDQWQHWILATTGDQPTPRVRPSDQTSDIAVTGLYAIGQDENWPFDTRGRRLQDELWKIESGGRPEEWSMRNRSD